MGPATITLVRGDPLDRAPSTRRLPDGPRPDLKGDSVMSRYKDLALRLAVVVSFVLVLAAPLRW